MKVSELWLRDWVNPEVELDQLVHLLTMAGLEVDAVSNATEPFNNVVIGEIKSISNHPDADKLNVCQVSDGENTFQVVCGAANVAVGALVPFAKVGAVLPGNKEIKSAKLRGVESSGMLCGASELGLEDIVDGLLILKEDAPLGENIRNYLDLDDSVIELDLTPNRGDCLSINGVAREVGVLTQTDINTPTFNISKPTINETLNVNLISPDYCPKYAGRIIRDIDNSAESPLWLREKLRRSGIRSIDPVVDITNYVMLELGQPMHAFDLNKIEGDINVRLAKKDEKLCLLDDSEQPLNEDLLLIADNKKPLAIAGIMGGKESGVSLGTKDIFLEAAFFSPEKMSGHARKLGLHTDSSHRFERGVDPDLLERAIERATDLLLSIVGGQAGPVSKVCDENYLKSSDQLVLRSNQIQRVLGFAIPSDRVEDILKRLGLDPKNIDCGWEVTIPSHRFDLEIEADLLEELARIYGYDQLPVSPPIASLKFNLSEESKLSSSDFSNHLVAKGYHEAITYSFISSDLQDLFNPQKTPVKLENPISSDMSVMRSTILPGLILTADYNLKRQQERIKLFESGSGFYLSNGEIKQDQLIAGVLVGSRWPETWLSTKGKNNIDFYDVKSDIESLLALTSHNDIKFTDFSEEENLPGFHPGQSAKIHLNNVVVGHLGLLHPKIQQKLNIEQEIWLFELNLNLISVKKVPKFKELSKFPEVRRDLAIVVDSNISAGEVIDITKQAAGEFLVGAVIFDQYDGDGIAEGKYSIGLGLTWQHHERTLKENEVNLLIDNVLVSLKQRFNASLR